MMKKAWIISLSFLLALFAFGLTACNDEKHVFGEWIEGVEATCTEDGYVGHYHCSHCDKDFDRDGNEIEIVVHAGHSFGEWIEGAEATCTEDGYVGHYRCLRCDKDFDRDGNEIEIVVHAAGHSFGEWNTVEEPTCQTEGRKTRICSKCPFVETEKLDTTEHVYGEWQHTKPATCIASGLDTRVCTTCDPSIATPVFETRIVDIDHEAHDPTIIKGTPATCLSGGMSDGEICSRCGETLKAQMPIEPLGHEGEFTYTSIKDDKSERHIKKCEREDCPGEEELCSITVTEDRKNCEEIGTSTRKCSLCDYEKVSELPAGSHSWNEGVVTTPSTCGKDGVITYTCKFCEETITAPDMVRPAHTSDNIWHNDSEKHYHECTECKSRLDEAEHSVFESWLSDGTNHWHICSVCSNKCDEAKHISSVVKGTPATCTETGLSDGAECSICAHELEQQTILPAINHSYGDWIRIEDPSDGVSGRDQRTCDNCGYHEYRDVDALGHQWGAWTSDGNGNHSRSCTIHTDIVQTEECVYDGGTSVDATCTDGAYTKYLCEFCHYHFETEHGEPLGHNYGSWQQVAGEGDDHIHSHYRDCLRCGDPNARESGNCELRLESEQLATCTTPGYKKMKCDTCGAVHEQITEEAKGHTICYEHKYKGSLFECEHKAYCTDCDYVGQTEPCKPQITYIEATCTQDKKSHYYCEICGVGRDIPYADTKLGHDWSELEFCGTIAEPKHRKHCTRPGCEEAIVSDCTKGTTTENPTCTAAGKVTEFCTECLHVLTEGELESVGHSLTEWKPTEDGRHTQKCTNCNEVFYSEHNFTVISDTPANCEQRGKKVSKCDQCHLEEIEYYGTIAKHEWVISSRTNDKHTAKCVICQTESSANHDWSESNLCSVCEYDGLEYTIQGAHCIVKNDDRVKNAKHIVIPRMHKVLKQDDTSYSDTEYTVEEIGGSAFLGNKKVETLSFPSTVKTIGELAFYYCTNLKEVTIVGEDQHLTKIEDHAFRSCSSLTTFYPPETLTQIGDFVFNDCTSLTNIKIGEALTEIGTGAFRNTGYVNNTEHWNNDMLYLGLHLIKVRNTQQADGTFSNVTAEVKDGTLSISSEAFSGCDKTVNVVLPASLMIVDRDAFLKCENIESVEFKGDVKQWFDIQFENDFASPLHYGSPKLSIKNAHDIITIPEGVTRIPAGTFRGTSITSIEIPDSITYIGEEAFENCTQLNSITIKSTKIGYIGKDAFKGTAYYNDPENWHEGKVFYVGNYLIEAKEELDGAYTLKEGTISIANDAFNGCNLLTNLTLSEELIYVGAGAFSGCDALVTINFTETSYYWLCNGFITRSIMVSDTNYSHYKTYYGAWQRSKKIN